MSTDRKRLTSAIQRIAREAPEIRKLLNDFRNSGGKPSESATSGSGAEDRQICCDGSTGSGGVNPGSGTNDPNESPQDGIDPDDPADISDNLFGVTDCDTGTPICFSGSDWIPPDRWDDPQQPPIEEFAEEGRYFNKDGETTNSLIFMCKEIAINFSFLVPAIYNGAEVNDNQTATCKYVSESGNTFDGVPVDIQDCGDMYDSACDDPLPTEDAWPEDGCVNLVIKGGKIVGSKFDPENDGSWSAPRDEVELCDAFGNSFKLKASGSIEGGWKSISAQNPDDGYLYDSSGKQIARISESEYSDPTM